MRGALSRQKNLPPRIVIDDIDPVGFEDAVARPVAAELHVVAGANGVAPAIVMHDGHETARGFVADDEGLTAIVDALHDATQLAARGARVVVAIVVVVIVVIVIAARVVETAEAMVRPTRKRLWL